MSAIIRTVLSAAIIALPCTSARADAPVGTVVSGEASFDYNGSKTTITAGNNAIIEYPKFNIDRNETVQFVQPTDTSRVLNRITGGDPSSILGNLQANGIVYFVNPAGIYFGQHATIDVGQFYAAAGNLSNSNFLAGRDNFERLSGQVHNEGTINASAIHLIGQNVRNTGNLNSPAGLVMLAAGDDVLIGRRGEHVFVNATKTTPDAASATAGVENAGNINADGGRALLAAGDLYALAVQNSGVIKARNVELAGQGSGEVWNRGTIDASSADTEGGRVEITGQYVGLDENSVIDASGAHGGGEVLIGGDFQGANTDIRNATATYVAEGAAIRADATTSGSGGKVIVWADETTRFHGNISATGFTHGGFAEVSGKQNLLYTGLADLRSANGLTGSLLLDPDNITISNAATSPGITDTFGTFEPPGDGDWNLNVLDLIAQLNSANVTVKTTNGDITVNDYISLATGWTADTELKLDAGNNININAGIEGIGTSSTLTLIARNNINITGGNNISAGNISLTAGQGIDINGDLSAANIALTATAGNILIAQADSVTIEGQYVTLKTHGGDIIVGNHDTNSRGRFSPHGFPTPAEGSLTFDTSHPTNTSLVGKTVFNHVSIGIAGGGYEYPVSILGGWEVNGQSLGDFFLFAGGLAVDAKGRDVSLKFITDGSDSYINYLDYFTVINADTITFKAGSNIRIGGVAPSFQGNNIIVESGFFGVFLGLTLDTTRAASTSGTTTIHGAIGSLDMWSTDTDGLNITGGLNLTETGTLFADSGALVIDAKNSAINIAGLVTGGTYIGYATTPIDLDSLAINNASSISISSAIVTTNTQSYSATGNIALTGTLQTSTAGQGIVLDTTSGTISLDPGAAIDSAGDLSVAGGLRLDTGGSISSDSMFVDGDNLDVLINTDLNLSGSFTVTNADNLTLASAIITDDAQSYTATGGITLTGTLQTLNSDQNISLSATSVSLAGTSEIDSTGTVAITGALNMASGAIVYAHETIVNALGGNIVLGGEVDTLTGGTFANAANITLTGTVTGVSGNFVFTGNQAMSVGGVIDAGSGGAVSLASTTGTISVASTGTVNGSNINITGGLDVADGAALTTPYGVGNITIDALNRDVVIATDLNMGSGTLGISNVRDLTIDTVITNDAQVYTASRNLTLTGTLQTTNTGEGVALTAQTGTLVTTAGAGIDSRGAITLNAAAATLGGIIYTDETLTIATTTGALAITGTHGGSIVGITSATGVSISGALNFSGANTINATTGTIAIAGAASVSGGTINLNGGVRIDNGASLTSDLGLVIDALSRDVVINADINLPALSVLDARYIETAAVTTFDDQDYRFGPNGAGAMKINGALVSETGDITITSNSGFPPPYATIFSTSPNGILISATLGNVTIGHNDTLLAYHDGSAAPDAGTIVIEAGGIASLGNLSASRRINVSADQIQLDGTVYQAPGIALSAVTSLDISGSAVTIATASAVNDITPPTTGSYTAVTIADDAMTGLSMNAGYFPLIATSTGAPYASVYERTQFWSEIVAPAVPDQEIKQNIVADEANPSNRTEPEAQQLQEIRAAATAAAFQQIDAETAISAATASQLRKLGIFPRPLTPQERNELGARFGTLSQIIPSEIRAPENYRVADGRLSEQSALAALAAYNRAFETAAGASRLPDLQAAILKTYREFRAANPGAPAAQYVRYIDTIEPGTAETRALHAFFDDVRALFLRIDRLGLTNNEVLVSKNVILRPLRVQGAPSSLLAPLMQVSPDTGPLITASY
ncbi:beta strand repeat-containing protein [Ereboglobus luteus]|uniref:beta strand repeat-containing protein n=1 Tax=Ereboglobus luteus TaxID=1796921 RepID=UPI0013750A8F|nr:filamentous hemagglutinin N-terminal domain-containing protein [Ereboglobus luteus]